MRTIGDILRTFLRLAFMRGIAVWGAILSSLGGVGGWGGVFPSLGGVGGGLLLAACSDDLTLPDTAPDDGKGIGQMVLFSAGTTENTVTRADAQTYYMPDDYRFVCRMYYKAQTGSNDFDVTGNTDQTTWLKVSGKLGNSLYWNKEYDPVGSNIGAGGVDDYGNDYDATAFYWQNRKDHAFLAWTDLNRATSLTGGTSKGSLKFGEDEKYKVYTGEKKKEWVMKGYQIYGISKLFSSLADMREYVQTTYVTDAECEAFNHLQNEIGSLYTWGDENAYYYQYGLQCKYTAQHSQYTNLTDTHRTWGWNQYKMFFDKIPYDEHHVDHFIPVENLEEELDKAGLVTKLRHPEKGYYVAAAEVRMNADNSKYLDDNNQEQDTPFYFYYATDENGNIRYNESNPRYTYYYNRLYDLEDVELYDEYPALSFDLTRGTKTNMGLQPDIAQAREIQAPIGATQEANRVNLYFKHMFSQLVVNVKNATDNSVTLEASDILKVELLGVTEKGYIFTELDGRGNVGYTTKSSTDTIAAAYQQIDFSKFSEQQLKDNPYGTSFQMFELSSDNTAPGYLKSFNAIAFGQLQAIRITWREHDKAEHVHTATYRIPDTELVNLKSGVRYIWNIEVRRGTLAIIRTEIVDWEVLEDEDHNGHVDGTIKS